jgi:hypothetical protein
MTSSSEAAGHIPSGVRSAAPAAGLRIALASWPADYGSPVGEDALADTTTVVETDVEVPSAAWAPREVRTPPADVVWFVDGVRRMEARAWLTADDGVTAPGLVASWAAGAVRCDGVAVIKRCGVQRGLFSATAERVGLDTPAGSFAACTAHADTEAGLRNALQAAMRAMELDVAREVAASGDLVFLDGPLRGRTQGRMVGYVKTQQVAYLPQALQETVTRLGVGQRTPLFLTRSDIWQHWSWYLRLSAVGNHPWEAVVRCETPKDGITLPAAVALADEVTTTLPRYASQPYRDARAPQNLYPIGGLERCLRHRLGSAAVIARHLRRAVVAQ